MLAKAILAHMIFDKTSALLAVADEKSHICVWKGAWRLSAAFPAEVPTLPPAALRRAVWGLYEQAALPSLFLPAKRKSAAVLPVQRAAPSFANNA